MFRGQLQANLHLLLPLSRARADVGGEFLGQLLVVGRKGVADSIVERRDVGAADSRLIASYVLPLLPEL